MGKADNEVSKVRKWFDEPDKQAEILAQEENLKLEGKLHQTKMELQAQFQATLQNQHPPLSQTPSDIQAKLPELVITKFYGNFMDWPRFWGHFTETIDKTSVPVITYSGSVTLHNRRIQQSEEHFTREVRERVGDSESIH